jgi:hypothetical protein
MTSLLLDLSNTLGGFLLAIGLLVLIAKVGNDLSRFSDRMGRSGGSSASSP